LTHRCTESAAAGTGSDFSERTQGFAGRVSHSAAVSAERSSAVVC